MTPDESIHELFEMINAIQEIQEIDGVICQHPNSPYFERMHAQAIIHKYLNTDPYVMIANAVLSDPVPLEQASNERLWRWLDIIKNYLTIKQVNKIMKKAE